MKFIIMITLFLSSFAAFAKDVNVKSYFRSNGTYVQGHTRSSPDSYKWNNYGLAKGSSYSFPLTRDSDNDGLPNQMDMDDDNDGISDDNE